MTDKLEALKAAARGIARLLGDIASFDSWDIDGDIVEIRFEDENGCDTGTDVSITETADKASQAIGELLAALKEKDKEIKLLNAHLDVRGKFADQRIAELDVKLFDQSILLDAAISRAEASGRREEHLKATVDVLSAKNAELERITEGVDQLAIDGGWTARGMSEYAKARDAENQDLMLTVGRLRTERAELEQRLQQPIKLPNKNDDEFWFGSAFQVAKFDRAVERAILAAGFKFKGE